MLSAKSGTSFDRLLRFACYLGRMRPVGVELEMEGQVPTSPVVEVFMIEEEALYTEWENANSEQGSNSEGALFTTVPSVRGLSHLESGPSGCQIR